MRAPHPHEVWLDLSQARVGGGELPPAAALTGVVLAPGQEVVLPGHVRRGWLVDGCDGASAPAPPDLVVSAVAARRSDARRAGCRTGAVAHVRDEASLAAAIEVMTTLDYLFVSLADETNIPLELLLVRAQATGTRVVRRARTLREAAVSLDVLERGADGVLLPSESFAEAGALSALLAARVGETVTLAEAEVVGLRAFGPGWRACVDTTVLLGADEALVVGSTSAGGLLACAEVHPLPYMPLRPFRVNAGAVHGYVWVPGGRTAYLTELSAGSSVLIVGTAGRARPVTVGRAKLEVRPLVQVDARVDGVPIGAVLQDDWHVRVLGATGEPRNVTTLRSGDRLLAHRAAAGRHVGHSVDEAIVEV